jgi:hypothetical protein
MNALVGYTGFVGSNLYAQGRFDCVYNSKNITDAYGLRPELLVYAGLRAEKFLANRDPEKDMGLIREAEENIRRIDPERLVLISTIDIFKTPVLVDERSEIDTDGLHPYGLNRYRLEQWVREHYPDALIIRLPGLFGRNIKKNFIYDFINLIPAMLRADKFEELVAQVPELQKYYVLQDNGFYKAAIPAEKRDEVKDLFRQTGFSALNFTDSRSRYQFYGLERLWDDMNTCLDAQLTLWHPATEPVSAAELHLYLSGKEFHNELPGVPADYDYRTIHAELFGGKNGYIAAKQQVLDEIRSFVLSAQRGG